MMLPALDTKKCLVKCSPCSFLEIWALVLGYNTIRFSHFWHFFPKGFLHHVSIILLLFFSLEVRVSLPPLHPPTLASDSHRRSDFVRPQYRLLEHSWGQQLPGRTGGGAPKTPALPSARAVGEPQWQLGRVGQPAVEQQGGVWGGGG